MEADDPRFRRARRRADRIRDEVPIVQVLMDYGYDVRGDGGDREEQFSCDLHGDGSDVKPSARVYPDSESWYCFACDKTRDAVETARAREGLDFWAAIKFLEKKYKLAPLPDDTGEPYPRSLSEQLHQTLKIPGKTFEDIQRIFELRLLMATQDRLFPLNTLATWWEAFDKVSWKVAKGFLQPDKGRTLMGKLNQRVLERFQKRR